MLKSLINKLTFKSYRDTKTAARRRQNYETLKSMIVERHLAGFKGLTITDKKYDKVDIQSFTPPMYQIAKNDKMQWVIFWDSKKMGEEVGWGPVPAPVPALALVAESTENGKV